MPLRFLLPAAALAAAAFLMAGDSPHAGAPQYNTKGELQFPADYREWVYLSSGLGMSYDSGSSNAENPTFDNVFVLPSAYKAFLETGRWPDPTVFMLEVRASASNGSINKAGHFQTDRLAIEAEVKDASRFPGKWAFFSFGKGSPSGRQLAATEACYTCHAEHGAVDNTFVQFYPTLLTVARQKGTLK